MSDGPKLVPFPVTTLLTDIPAQLRDLAGAIERGAHGKVGTVALVMAHDGSVPVSVSSYGDTDPMRALALLQMGVHRLAGMLLVGSVARGK